MTSKRQLPPHKKLIVWQKAFTLGLEVYRVAKKLPASERFELGAQLRTACASITGNIAEGKVAKRKASSRSFWAWLEALSGKSILTSNSPSGLGS